ncbi:type VI secretion system-associated FHA domain protein TagH [Photobacterium lutimaris]|uniref:Type VI secretion system-associated FHA domain protein TagH n=1 Tax=Photobacterium lutimaris TaxID=388278 RepID=A0A2T3IZL0_9GAMM|nr:type VI secretion system-associated FHA domain protein TagH [Photobacterium lutimaris]PSU34126.1 type VI secretion system-associated FHA domain protein TagH [Photobacterium lutimaris]TDR75697.1 FHA domain protein [Photobacterium lutimaris]
MELILSVLSYHRFTSDLVNKMSFSFNDKKDTYSIGRSSQSDWCLPDPERVISGQHAFIRCYPGEFLITDLSTNGLFINKSIEALGKDNVYRLNNGDILSLGDYEIEVSLFESATAGSASQQHQISNADEIKKSMGHVGIPVKEQHFSNLQASGESSEGPEKPAVINASRPEFNGGPEDSFALTLSDYSEPGSFNENAIPEDWEHMLGSSITSPPEAKTNSLDDEVDAYRINESKSRPGNTPERKLADNGLDNNLSPDAAAFIRGLGINPDMIPAGASELWWNELGIITQQLMAGLMDALHQRSIFKQNSRLNQTLFKRQENNPLKFSATIEDAIHNLLNRNSTSFLSADKAVNEAFRDLEKHEQALLAGVEGTVHGLVKLLSPDSISIRGREHTLWQRITPSNTKSNNWDTYVAMYQRLEHDLDGASKAFYLDDFVKSYEAYLKGVK